MTSLKSILINSWHPTRYVVTRFFADRCSENAAALTYMSLFALVPLLTVLYTMASALPAFQGLEDQMQGILFEHLIPETGSELRQYLNDFSAQAKTLTGPGIAFLVVTAVLMLRNVETAFNYIWRARSNRSPISSFLLYWAILTLAPITIGVALGLGTYINSFANSLANYDVLGVRAFFLHAAPLALSTVGFTLLYAAVPNCAVPVRHALIGGLLAAIAFNIARSVFTKLVVGSSITFIYGAFAAVPLFLLWIYVSWNIVLMGGVVVHSLSAYQDAEQAGRPRVLKALDVLHLFWTKQKSGKAVSEIELFDDRHDHLKGLDSETWGGLRDELLRRKVITQNERGHYLLCRDLHSLTFWQLKEWVNEEQPLNREQVESNLAWQARAYGLLKQQRNDQRDLLNLTLAELFDQ